MKKLLVIALSFCLVGLCSAHSGRTDSSGGHNNYSDGTYHYHNAGTTSNSYDVSLNNNFICPDPPGYQRLSSGYLPGSGFCIGGPSAKLCKERLKTMTTWCLKKEPKSTIGKVWSFVFGD